MHYFMNREGDIFDTVEFRVGIKGEDLLLLPDSNKEADKCQKNLKKTN